MKNGSNLAEVMRLKKMTDQKLAESIGMSYASVRQWKAGIVPALATREKVATALVVMASDIWPNQAGGAR